MLLYPILSMHEQVHTGICLTSRAAVADSGWPTEIYLLQDAEPALKRSICCTPLVPASYSAHL